jgi:hypothetical protein
VDPVLDTDDIREWSHQPGFGDRRRETEVVGRIGEGDIVCVRSQIGDEAQRVGAMNGHLLRGAKRIDVRRDGAEAQWCALDEVGVLGAT